MKKQMSAVFILAGTAIGSGMISLPIILSHIGLWHTVILMVVCSIVTYFSALIRTELNLHSDSRFTLEDVGLKFSGKRAALIGSVCLKILPFSLLSAYIYALGSLLGSGGEIKLLLALMVFIILTFSSPQIMEFNRRVFVLLIVAVIGAILLMIVSVDFTVSPLQSHDIQLSKLSIILPTVFTSFGFQASLHTLTNFFGNDREKIKKACFWGSLIPAVVYICWTIAIIFAISNTQPVLFMKMASSGIDVNEFIDALCNASNGSLIRSGIFVISVLSIMTSLIGVGISLVEDLEMTFQRMQIRKLHKQTKRIVSGLIAVIPATIVAICVPKAFISFLSFAGMILAIIAIFLPVYLFLRMKKQENTKLIRSNFMIAIVLLFGIGVVLCECFNLFFA